MKIKFKGIVESAHGKVDGSSNVSYRTLYGTDHTYTWNRDTKMRLTPQRHLQQEAMRQANLAATAILADGEQTALWMERFKAQSKSSFIPPTWDVVVITKLWMGEII